ncbi:uncharacterized protein [Aegilops tauschii subsp. strangulata]|uniref:uncharacterized protein n=1 Tax=Aegilops tauschii subsp. strangulata TaxID=200361 RepID=UPI00098B33DE|nr:uncharacterized protein LOC109735555 [Aegilops tauschii subsp. strangulata]
MAAIKIKLVVDKPRKRVLFADAGSDFVDVILAFLTLPLSAVQLTAGASLPGCLANLCGSVDRLRDAQLLKVNACHGTLHRPTHKDEFGCNNRFGCSACTPFVEKHAPPHRRRCWEVAMARLVHVYNQTPRKEMFSNWNERFVISDNWVIKHASTSNVVSFLRGLGADGIRDGYEEVDVDVGWAEVPIKLFYDRKDRKVMYAECKHEFVDLLLSFMTYPIGCILKSMARTSHLCGSFNNLYNSAAGLDVAGFLSGPCIRDIKTLLDPSLDPFKIGCSFRKDKRSCHSCDPEFVSGHTYVVDDDLRTYQASAVSVLKHWRKRDLVEMDIGISKQEAAALLLPAVNSKTALTDAFKGRFMQEAQQLPPLPPLERRMGAPSVEKMQIFVRIFAGETITLDVATSDTVADVRSKIQARRKLTDSCGLAYGGKYLQDPWTLADCGIHREATIHAEFFHRCS